MTFDLAQGVPSLAAYRQLLGTPEFARLTAYSDSFQKRHHETLAYYRHRWVSDPLRAWSRQWEYPFVLQEVLKAGAQKSEPGLKVLDAGSGVTFLPWLLLEQGISGTMHCCDRDSVLQGIYRKINEASTGQVQFALADLRQLPYDDSSIDVVYCISVLEHTRDYRTIVRDFKRVLRPGGRLIITFDVSLDGLHDISVEQGQVLLDDLCAEFQGGATLQYSLLEAVSGSILTTNEAANIDPALLPWKHPLLSRLKTSLKKRRLVSWPPTLTVFCLSLEKAIDV
jgi:SAM-dependent methyltransferase